MNKYIIIFINKQCQIVEGEDVLKRIILQHAQKNVVGVYELGNKKICHHTVVIEDEK